MLHKSSHQATSRLPAQAPQHLPSASSHLCAAQLQPCNIWPHLPSPSSDLVDQAQRNLRSSPLNLIPNLHPAAETQDQPGPLPRSPLQCSSRADHSHMSAPSKLLQAGKHQPVRPTCQLHPLSKADQVRAGLNPGRAASHADPCSHCNLPSQPL